MFGYEFGDRLPVHDHGYVALLEVMGNDETIVDAARISYDRRGNSEDRGLIRYLLRHRHTSPFEMGVLRFEIKMPIFVARQWIRHRTASLNEMSARYTELPEEMFVPRVVSLQSKDNKQGRQMFPDPNSLRDEFLGKIIERANTTSYTHYQTLLDAGVARELARGVLPVNIYTKFVWKMDLHNLMHFLDLRLDPHAQQEIRDFAKVIEKLVALHFPITYEAFVDYVKEAYTCSRMEIAALRDIIKFATEMADERFGEGYDPAALCENRGMSKREIENFRRVFING